MDSVLGMASEFRSLGDAGAIGSSWVMIEMTPTAYYLSGRGNGAAFKPHIAPSGFPRARDAIRTALYWAEYLEAPIIYVSKRRLASG